MKQIILGLILGLAFIAPSHAANALAANLDGYVVDENKKPIEGVKVVLIHHDTGRVIERATNSKGRYHFQGMRVDGEYTVAILTPIQDGHKVLARDGRFLLGKNHRQNFVVGEPSFFQSWQWRGFEERNELFLSFGSKQ